MKITRDFHPSQILVILKVQRYSYYGGFACYSVSVVLMTLILFAPNDYVRISAYFSQLAAFITGFKLEQLRKMISDDHYADLHGRSLQGFSSHLEASFKPPAREVLLEQPKVIHSHPVLRALYSQKIECDLAGELKSPSFNRTLVKPTNCTAAKVLGIGKELQLDLALDRPPIISISKGAIAIDTPRPDRQFAKFSEYWKASNKFEAAIGVDINNQLVSIDLSHPESCHIVAAGTTGSGKSVWLQSLLLSLLIGRSPDELQVVICDPKRVSFFAFKDCANLLVPIISTPEEVIHIGNWLIQLMQQRYELFSAMQVENIDQYNARVSTKLPRILFLMDEYGDLKSACYSGRDEKEGKKIWDQILNINIRLGQMARASGISEAVITQKAVKVIDTNVRANLPARVLLKVLEEGDTECILGKVSYDGRDLLGRGDLFFNGDRLQSLLCEPSDFDKLTKGSPVYDPKDLDLKNAVVAVRTSRVDESVDGLTSMHQKILAYARKKEVVSPRDVISGIADFRNIKSSVVRDYLEDLANHGYGVYQDDRFRSLE